MEFTNLSREEKKAYDLERCVSTKKSGVSQNIGYCSTGNQLPENSAIYGGGLSQTSEKRVLYIEVL